MTPDTPTHVVHYLGCSEPCTCGAWDKAVKGDAARQVTYEMLTEAIEKVRNAEREPACTHVVHPLEYERGGWCICAQCFIAVNVPPHPRHDDAR